MTADDKTDPKASIVKAALRANPINVVILVCMAAFAWGGYVVVGRMVKHFDRMEVIMDKHAESSAATARAIERFTYDAQSGREGAVKEVVSAVDHCCSRRR